MINVADPTAFDLATGQAIVPDPAADSETAMTIKSGKSLRKVTLEQRAPLLIQFDKDLSSVRRMVQFPLRTGTALGLEMGSDGSVNALLRLRPGDGSKALLKALNATVIKREGRDNDLFGSLVLHYNVRLNFSGPTILPDAPSICITCSKAALLLPIV